MIGTGLLYTAFFQIMWKGGAFEFLFPAVFWSFIIMYALFLLGKHTGVIVPAPRNL